MEKYWGNLRKLRYKKQLTWVNTKEKIFLIGKSIFVILLFDYFFYRALWAFFPLSFLGYLYYQMEIKSLTKKKKAMAKEQFKELMFLVSTGQRAGYSAENAFLSGYQEMKNMYGENSSICQMLSVLKNGGENHIPLTRIWKKIGESAGIQEIQEFAEVYEISYTSSGNMSAVMERTAGIIVQKLETEKEIDVMLSARKMEQKIMNGMPFFIMLYINFTSPGYFDALYQTATGAAIMSICLLIYLTAYMISQKLVDIEV